VKITFPPPWSTLRSIGNSSIVKLTIVIPVLGYLIIFNQSLSKYLALIHEVFHDPDPLVAGHVSWRLTYLYLGLCWFGIGSALFAIFCPPELKKYGSPSEYIGGEIDNLSILELNNIVEQLDSSVIADKLTKHVTNLMERYDIFSAGAAPRDDEIEADGMTIYFQNLDQTATITRGSVAIFFSLGTCFTAVPTIEVFLRVSRIALDQALTFFH
jgi:hypothetical protein